MGHFFRQTCSIGGALPGLKPNRRLEASFTRAFVAPRVGRIVLVNACANRQGRRSPARDGTREETSMLEIGLFHNGASILSIVNGKDGVTFNDGSLNEVHRAAQETLVNQVRQGILAEKLGFQSFWMTEHHFQPRARR
jgi:hypothetical protein